MRTQLIVVGLLIELVSLDRVADAQWMKTNGPFGPSTVNAITI